MNGTGGRPFARLERVAEGRSGIALVAAWAFAEAIVFPIIPDIPIGLLALVAPRRARVLFVALVAAALAGSAVLYAMTLADPGAVASMLVALPGIDHATLDQARVAVAGGDPRSIALFGAGIPIKVYTWAWAIGPATPLAFAAAVVLNRITRIGPLLALLAVIGWLAPDFIRRHDRVVLLAYAAFYGLTYALYWR